MMPDEKLDLTICLFLLTDIDVDGDVSLWLCVCFSHMEGTGLYTVDDSGGGLCLVGLREILPGFLLLLVQQIAAGLDNSLGRRKAKVKVMLLDWMKL